MTKEGGGDDTTELGALYAGKGRSPDQARGWQVESSSKRSRRGDLCINSEIATLLRSSQRRVITKIKPSQKHSRTHAT
jgi:hypothetical protein